MRPISIFIVVFVAFQTSLVLPTVTHLAIAAELDCDNALYTIDMVACADKDFAAADKKLNDVYKKAREVLKVIDSEDGGGMKSFIAGQKAWIIYRDSYCAAAAGIETPNISLWHVELAYCRARVTKARTDELQFYIDEPRA